MDRQDDQKIAAVGVGLEDGHRRTVLLHRAQYAGKIFKGPLDKQLQEALAYIRNYMLKMEITKVDGQAEAIHTWNIPYKAVEEALSNAVYHRSYEIYEPITVTLTPEKMEILIPSTMTTSHTSMTSRPLHNSRRQKLFWSKVL